MTELPNLSEPPSVTAPLAIDMTGLFAPEPPAASFQEDFGFRLASDGSYLLPAGVIAVEPSTDEGRVMLVDFLKTMGLPPTLSVRGDRPLSFFRLADPAVLQALQSVLPSGVRLASQGDSVSFPAGWQPDDASAKVPADLSELTAAEVALVSRPRPDPVVTSNPLLPFSLRGQSERFKKLAVEARPLLGDVCLRGQVTLWYAGPNTGKTLIGLSLVVDAVREGRIAGGNVFYINADDNGSGFAEKLQIMDDIGANTLSPGFRGLQTRELIGLLHKMAEQDEARGVLIIIDTVKKFASLMDKKDASSLANAFRQVAMKGGTVLGFAHTTKNANADGTPRYAGTTDLVDDADAVYIIQPLSTSAQPGERVVEFKRVKSRGNCAEAAAYVYASEAGISYEERLASVRWVDPMQMDEFRRVEAEKSDAEVIAMVGACIAEGINTKMVLAKEVAERTGVSARAAGRLLDRYTGVDPSQHRWRFRRQGHGAQVYELLPSLAEPT